MAGPTGAVAQHDLGLDHFRGLALWFILVDGLTSIDPANRTLRNLGFRDATEIVSFISGCGSAPDCGGACDHGCVFSYMGARAMRRCRQMDGAHGVMVVSCIVEVA